MTNNTFYYLGIEVKAEAAEERKRRVEWLEKYENALRNELTDTRWNQLNDGTITKEKAIEYATKRIEKDVAKKLERKLAHLDEVAAAPDLEYMTIETYFNNYGTCFAVVRTNNERNEGKAGGYGYDKESAAAADAMNKDFAILKALYTIKEKALAEGKTDESKTACTGRDNREIIGYGAGYAATPYFEGGVGINCFFAILRKAGFETKTEWGRKENFYHTHKA